MHPPWFPTDALVNGSRITSKCHLTNAASRTVLPSVAQRHTASFMHVAAPAPAPAQRCLSHQQTTLGASAAALSDRVGAQRHLDIARRIQHGSSPSGLQLQLQLDPSPLALQQGANPLLVRSSVVIVIFLLPQHRTSLGSRLDANPAASISLLSRLCAPVPGNWLANRRPLAMIYALLEAHHCLYRRVPTPRLSRAWPRYQAAPPRQYLPIPHNKPPQKRLPSWPRSPKDGSDQPMPRAQGASRSSLT